MSATSPISQTLPRRAASALGRRASMAALLATLLGVSACVTTPTRMAAPGDLGQTAEVLDVGARAQGTGLFAAEDFQVGPYQVSHVKRGWTSSEGSSLGLFSSKTQKQGFSYRFKGQRDWDGSCEYRSKEQGLKIGVQLENNKATLDCSCRHGEQTVRLELKDEWKPLEGRLYVGGAEYRMSQVAERRTQNGMPVEQSLKSPALGYRVDSLRGSAIAAVEVLHPGRIWQQRQLPAEQREPMACALAGLMLYGPQDGR
ncbi:MAG: hypothetical protein CFE41_14835 [Burkholderiales bacterium PBB2]|nr:MAG: hypothetical protein CFE41_14835 [Burkholderiales bacterium PBB2]